MLLLTLWLLAFTGLATANDEAFERYWLEDVAFTRRLLLQHQNDLMVDTPFHEFPEETSRRDKRAAGNNCPAGYTGTFCESPMCDQRVDLATSDMQITNVEKKIAAGCAEPVTIYVDSHLYFFRISVQTQNGQSRPGGQLYDSQMNKINSNTDRLQGPVHIYNYINLTSDHGPGIYTFAASSADNDDCYVTASSATPLVAFGGFVDSVFSDKVQQAKPSPTSTSVQGNPIAMVNSYFGFTITNATTNDAPRYVSFHRQLTSDLQYAPLPVRSRYNCNADQFVGPYACSDAGGDYFLKVRGLDDSGNVWQRVYGFTCDPNPSFPPPDEPTPSPGSVVTCENGGTVIQQKDQSVCYCGPHFTGDTCGIKICDNGGTLSLQKACICADGFSGDFCQHVSCDKKERDFSLTKRGLTFVIRANAVDQVKKEIHRAARQIIAYFDDKGIGDFDEYALVMVVNGETIALNTYPDQVDFLADIMGDDDLWSKSDDCSDKVFLGLLEALSLSTNTKYLKGPVFLFTDALSNDDSSTFADLGALLSTFKNPVFTIFYGGGTDQCNVKTTDDGYRYFRILSQFTGGLVVKTDTTENAISDAAYSIAIGFFNNNLLAAHDLIDSCQYAPQYHVFFVDESVDYITVIASGPAKLRVIDTNGNTLASDQDFTIADLQLSSYPSPTKGHYRLSVDPQGQIAPCAYRVYARTRYEAFLAASTFINNDVTYYQPIYNRDMHLVGTINNVDFPDPESLFAEIVIWKEDDNSLDTDRRTVIYASNGLYRDGCSYNLYFGQWKCTERDRIFYANMYVTDSTGFTVMRSTVGQCSTAGGVIETGCRNGGVKYKNKCLCTAGWSGDVCQTADCYNGGTPHGDHCECSVGYGGTHCQLNRCPNKNTKVQFQPRGITISLIVQNSKDLLSPLLAMAKIAPQVVHNMHSTHREWVGSYAFWEFDDTNFDYLIKTPFVDDIIGEINDMIAKRRSRPLIRQAACFGLLDPSSFRPWCFKQHGSLLVR